MGDVSPDCLHFLAPADLPGWIPASIDASIYGYTSISQATEAMPAAMQLALSCMQCFTLLLKCNKELNSKQVRQVLAALAAEPATGKDTDTVPVSKPPASTV